MSANLTQNFSNSDSAFAKAPADKTQRSEAAFAAAVRDLLLFGGSTNLFSDPGNLVLNLPYRFFAYTAPAWAKKGFFDFHFPFRFSKDGPSEFLDVFFNTLHKKLEAVKTNRLKAVSLKNDAWEFDAVLKLLAPELEFADPSEKLDFLKNQCSLKDEGHVQFEDQQIFLSRYAMMLVAINISARKNMSKAFQDDLNSPLFSDGNDPDAMQKSKADFESEMRLRFAYYYFARSDINNADTKTIVAEIWNHIRGKQLKEAYESAMAKLDFTAKALLSPEDNKKFFGLLGKFKLEYIFDILFSKRKGDFKTEFEDALNDAGYVFERGKWRKGKDTAAQYPGGTFSPHIGFFLCRCINAFCEFIEQEKENCPEDNRQEWLESLAKNFFTAVRNEYGKADKGVDFIAAPKFVNQHHKNARKQADAAEAGSGRTIVDKLSGETTRESPGFIDLCKWQTLFSKDTEACLNYRKGDERTLEKLHAQFAANPCQETADEIYEAEKDLIELNMSIYGCNCNAWIRIPMLGRDGKPVPRPLIGDKKPVRIESFPEPVKNTQTTLFPFVVPYDIDVGQIELPNEPFEKILADLPEIHYSTAEKFHRFKKTENGWPRIKDGNYECINEFLHEEYNPETWTTMDGKPSNTGRTRKNCKLKYFLFEWDHLDPKEQYKKLLAYEKYIERAVWSAGENGSIHIKIKALYEPIVLEEYDWLRRHMLIKFGFFDSDPNTKDNSRCTRVPNATSPNTGKPQKLLHYNPDACFSENWRPLFMAERKEAERQKALAAQHKASMLYYTADSNDKWRNYWIDRTKEARAMLTEGNRTAALPKIINTSASSVLSEQDFIDLLGDLLEKDNINYLKTLYKANTH